MTYKSKVKPLKRADRGAAVKDLQRAVNAIVVAHKMPWRKVTVDGVLGPHTLKVVAFAAWLIGLRAVWVRTAQGGKVPVRLQRLLRREERRSAGDLVRKGRRVSKIRKIRKAHAARPVSNDGLAEFDGKIVAAWIAYWLEKSRKAGWKGTVTSGWRDPAYSEQLCFAMCGAPTCPGRCGGRSSNHSGKGDNVKGDAGAVDVTDYMNFGRIQKQIGSPLRNALGPADPVHFSFSGR